jgi:DNA-binding CsgD family transcriptional regulator
VLVLHKLLESAREMRRSGIETLSDRELQVFQMLGAGISTREMAAELKLSFKTIETYREHIKHKLGLDSAPQLIRCATEWVQGAALSPSPPAKNISAGPRS